MDSIPSFHVCVNKFSIGIIATWLSLAGSVPALAQVKQNKK